MSRWLEKYQISIWMYGYSQIQGTRSKKRWRTMGQICPVLSTIIWTLSPGLENNRTLKCWSGIFPTILTYIIMLENCQNNISVYGCSPIQGTTFYFCLNLMKPGSQSGTYAFFLQLCKRPKLSSNPSFPNSLIEYFWHKLVYQSCYTSNADIYEWRV